jgi:hypothetical protein
MAMAKLQRRTSPIMNQKTIMNIAVLLILIGLTTYTILNVEYMKKSPCEICEEKLGRTCVVLENPGYNIPQLPELKLPTDYKPENYINK